MVSFAGLVVAAVGKLVDLGFGSEPKYEIFCR
jgi:hypothetical protein